MKINHNNIKSPFKRAFNFLRTVFTNSPFDTSQLTFNSKPHPLFTVNY